MFDFNNPKNYHENFKPQLLPTLTTEDNIEPKTIEK